MSEENQNVPSPQAPSDGRSGTSGLAIAGLVIGIIALLGAWIPLLNVGSAFIAVIGLVLSIIGLVKVRKQVSGKGMAIAATVLNIVALVVVIAMYGTAGAAYNAATSDESSSSSAVEQSESSADSEGESAASSSDTASKFKKIKHGMSLNQVEKIMGSEGDEQASSSVSDNEATVYQWTTDDFGVVSVTFENDKVINKAQISLGSGSGPEATKAKYKKVKNGMSLKQVEKIFGGEGELSSDTNIAGYSSQVYTWYGDSLGSSCTIVFSNGEVTSKAQYGLK